MAIYSRVPSNVRITKISYRTQESVGTRHQHWHDHVISGTGFYEDERFATRDGFFVEELDVAGQSTGRFQVVGPRQFAEEFAPAAGDATTPAPAHDVFGAVAAANELCDELGLTAHLADASDEEREYVAAFIRLPLLSEVKQIFVNGTAPYGMTAQSLVLGTLGELLDIHPDARAYNSHPGVPIWHGSVDSPSPIEGALEAEARVPEPEHSLGGVVWFDGVKFCDLSVNPDGTLTSFMAPPSASSH